MSSKGLSTRWIAISIGVLPIRAGVLGPLSAIFTYAASELVLKPSARAATRFLHLAVYQLRAAGL